MPRATKKKVKPSTLKAKLDHYVNNRKPITLTQWKKLKPGTVVDLVGIRHDYNKPQEPIDSCSLCSLLVLPGEGAEHPFNGNKVLRLFRLHQEVSVYDCIPRNDPRIRTISLNVTGNGTEDAVVEYYHCLDNQTAFYLRGE